MRPSLSPLRPLCWLPLSCFVVGGVGCAVDGAAADHRAAVVAAQPAASEACTVDLPAHVIAVRANDDGVVYSVGTGGDGVVIHRAVGIGCELQETTDRIAARELLDLDNRGNLYVFPAPGTRTASPTMLPDTPFGDVVTRVAVDGSLVNVVSAGRGIWDFSVAPDGDALWMTACGPTGVFDLADDGTMTVAKMPLPESLWAQMPSVLTDADTFWSVGFRTGDGCDDEMGCGYALVRADAAGVVDVGSTVMDLGEGDEHATLLRCGRHVCGVTGSAVVEWDDSGAIATTVVASSIAGRGETIVGVTGNRHGLYIQLVGDEGTRIMFVAEAS